MKEIAIIKKIGKKWCVISERTGKRLGCYTKKRDAVERLVQVEWWKHHSAGKYECYCNECGYEFVSNRPCWTIRCPICGDDDIDELTGEIL